MENEICAELSFLFFLFFFLFSLVVQKMEIFRYKKRFGVSMTSRSLKIRISLLVFLRELVKGNFGVISKKS